MQKVSFYNIKPESGCLMKKMSLFSSLFRNLKSKIEYFVYSLSGEGLMVCGISLGICVE